MDNVSQMLMMGESKAVKTYVAITFNAAPGIHFYELNENGLTTIAVSGIDIKSNYNASSFSPNGDYFAVVSSEGSQLDIYKRAGLTFTKLNFDSGITEGAGLDVMFSPDNEYLVATINASSSTLVMYKRNGDTFTRISDPVYPSTIAPRVSFSDDGIYLATSGRIIYKRQGDVFTSIPFTPGTTGGFVFLTQSLDYFAASSATHPYLFIYKRSGDTFTLLSTPNFVFSSGGGRGISFSPDGTYLAATSISSLMTVYKRNGDIFTKLDNVEVIVNIGAYTHTTFTPDGLYLITSSSSTIIIYKREGDVFTLLENTINVNTTLSSITVYTDNL